MQTVGQMIRQRREKLGLTVTALAEGVGTTKAYLSMIENHRVANPPSRQVLEALERALRISDGELVGAAEWQNTPAAIRAEFENIAKTAQQGQELARWLKASGGRRKDGAKSLDKLFKSGELSARINKMLRDAEQDGSGIDSQVPVRYQVPLINKVAAGYPRNFTDLDYPAMSADEYVPCPDIHDPQAFAARVVGDSMTPQYQQGDIVIFSPAAEVTDGCDCFVRIEPDHETTFKRVFFDNGNIRLQPLNPRFAPQTFKREQIVGLYRAVTKIQTLV